VSRFKARPAGIERTNLLEEEITVTEPSKRRHCPALVALILLTPVQAVLLGVPPTPAAEPLVAVEPAADAVLAADIVTMKKLGMELYVHKAPFVVFVAQNDTQDFQMGYYGLPPVVLIHERLDGQLKHEKEEKDTFIASLHVGEGFEFSAKYRVIDSEECRIESTWIVRATQVWEDLNADGVFEMRFKLNPQQNDRASEPEIRYEGRWQAARGATQPEGPQWFVASTGEPVHLDKSSGQWLKGKTAEADATPACPATTRKPPAAADFDADIASATKDIEKEGLRLYFSKDPFVAFAANQFPEEAQFVIARCGLPRVVLAHQVVEKDKRTDLFGAVLVLKENFMLMCTYKVLDPKHYCIESTGMQKGWQRLTDLNADGELDLREKMAAEDKTRAEEIEIRYDGQWQAARRTAGPEGPQWFLSTGEPVHFDGGSGRWTKRAGG
jgi:hypothetical protein